MITKNKKITLVSHDAGGAEILSSYVRENNLDCYFVLEGPARHIFERKLGEIETVSLSQIIENSDELLCGTSWQSDLEWQAIGLAKEIGIPSTVYLDHWVNYSERFIRNNIEHLPDKIVVGDAEAMKLAKLHFPSIPIVFIQNPYLIEIQKELDDIKKHKIEKNKNGKYVLFVCEDISTHSLLKYGKSDYLGYTEFDAIKYFLDNYNLISEDIVKVLFRPHPSESKKKYNNIINKYSKIASLSDGKSLLEEIVESDLVVGCESMAMVVGLLCDKRVISCIPPAGKRMSLPFENIEILSSIKKDNEH